MLHDINIFGKMERRKKSDLLSDSTVSLVLHIKDQRELLLVCT